MALGLPDIVVPQTPLDFTDERLAIGDKEVFVTKMTSYMAELEAWAAANNVSLTSVKAFRDALNALDISAFTTAFFDPADTLPVPANGKAAFYVLNTGDDENATEIQTGTVNGIANTPFANFTLAAPTADNIRIAIDRNGAIAARVTCPCVLDSAAGTAFDMPVDGRGVVLTSKDSQWIVSGWDRAGGLARVITTTGFTYPEFPYAQTTPGDLSTRSYDEAKAKMIAGGGVAGTDAIYTTPKGHKYTFGLRIDGTGELECIQIDGPNVPVYEFTSNINPNVAPQAALLPADVATGFTWQERDLRTGVTTTKRYDGSEIEDIAAHDPVGSAKAVLAAHLQHEFNVDKYGAIAGSVSDQTLAINDAIAAATAHRDATGVHPTITFDSGDYRAVNIHIPHKINVVFRNNSRLVALINDDDYDESMPALTLGSRDKGVSFSRHVGLSVVALSSYDGVWRRGMVGVCLLNHYYSMIDLNGVSGFYSNLRLLAADGFGCAYNRIYNGAMKAGAIMCEFRSEGHSQSYPNENTFIGMKMQSTSSMNKQGSVFGIAYTREDGIGYVGHNSNIFYGGSFELGNGSGYIWPGAITANAGQRYCANGLEYEVDASMTLPASAPTHTTGTVGGLTYIGEYRRSPVLLADGVGGSLFVRDARWESGYGEAMVRRGQQFPVTEIDLHFTIRSVTEAPNQRDIDFGFYSKGAIKAQDSSVTYGNSHVQSSPLVIPDAHKSFICDVDGNWYSPIFGMVASTGLIFGAANGQGADEMTMWDGFITSSGARLPALFVDTDGGAHFDVQCSVDGLEYGLDQRYRLMPYESLKGNPSVRAAATLEDIEVYLRGGGYLSTGTLVNGGTTQTHSKFGLVTGVSGVVALGLAWAKRPIADVVIHRQPLAVEMAERTPRLLHPNTIDGTAQLSGPRVSTGEPDLGWFTVANETIRDIINDVEYKVVSAGITAHQWTASSSVVEGVLASNSGRTYKALTSGTSGVTEPTHASGVASDGTIDWEYMCDVAVIEKRDDFSDLATYADDAAAGAGGIESGQLYKTATGQLMVKS